MINEVTTLQSSWFFFWVGVLLISSAFTFKNKIETLRANMVDLLVAVFLAHAILNSTIHDGFVLSRANVEAVGLCWYYYLLKNVFTKKELSIPFFEFSLLVLTLVQVCIAALQFYGVIPSLNQYFKVTGFYFNPGPFAIYLAVLMIMCLALFLFSEIKSTRIVAAPSFLLSLLLLLFMFSRAAWVGAFAGSLLVIEVRFLFFANLLKPLGISAKIIALPFVIAAVVLGSSCLFFFLKDSANGRVLTWKLTTAIIKDHYLTGVGSRRFSSSLIKYQSKYFQENPDKKPAEEGQLAGETWFAFNDILQITAQQGLLGLGFLASLLFIIANSSAQIIRTIITKNARADTTALALGFMTMLLVILVAGLFSYPLTLLPIQIMFYSAVAFLSSNFDLINKTHRTFKLRLSTVGKSTTILLCVFSGVYFMCYGINLYSGYKEWRSAETTDFPKIDFDNLAEAYPFLAENSWFVVSRANQLFANSKFEEGINTLEEIKKSCPYKTLYYSLGFAYQQLNRNDKAEEQYKFLENALPSLVRPKYELAMLYYDTHQKRKWREKAIELINFSPKIRSASTDAMVSRIKELYNDDF
jgi:O-antigen ligase